MEDIVTQTSNVMNKHLNFTGLQKGKPLQQLEQKEQIPKQFHPHLQQLPNEYSWETKKSTINPFEWELMQ